MGKAFDYSPASRRSFRSHALLMLTAMIWGFAFVAQRAGMTHIGPFTFNAIRFALGAAVLSPFVRREVPRGRSSMADARGILITGALLFLGASSQQAGLVFTTAGKAGFITGLYVVLVPLMALPLGYRPGVAAWCGSILATLGLYLLSAQRGLSLAPGDGLVLLGAFWWAAHVLAIGHFSPRIGPLRLARAQFAVCAALSAAIAMAAESHGFGGIRAAILPLLYSGILSVGLGYTLQVVAQEHTSPSHAAIILSLESVFAAVGGWAVLGERASSRQAVGCAVMLAGMICSQISVPSTRHTRDGPTARE